MLAERVFGIGARVVGGREAGVELEPLDPQVWLALGAVPGPSFRLGVPGRAAHASMRREGVSALVVRGAESDLLLADTADEMERRGPRARVVTFPGIGHAPALNVPGQIGLVAEFFAA